MATDNDVIVFCEGWDDEPTTTEQPVPMHLLVAAGKPAETFVDAVMADIHASGIRFHEGWDEEEVTSPEEPIPAWMLVSQVH